MKEFSGKVALVTGASGRIGPAVAVAFARQGASVVVNYLSRQDLAERTAAQVEEAGGKALIYEADVRDRAQVKEMVSGALETFGRLDILINNARTAHPKKKFLDLDWEKDILSQFIIHVGGAFHCCQEAVPHMIRQGGGSIINMSTGGIRHTSITTGAYGPAKSALRNFTMNLAWQLGEYNIRVNSVSPGSTVTAENPGYRTPEQLEEVRMSTPLRSLSTPEDTANMTVFLCSEGARNVTGADISTGGGKVIVY